jgi:trk system potassium uptake protein
LAVPHIAFLTLAVGALLGYGLLTQDFGFELETDPQLAGHLWARAILSSSILALVLGGLTMAYQIASPGILRGLVNVLLFSASTVALAAEREIVESGEWSKGALPALGFFTLGATVLGFFSEVGLLALAARLVFAIIWSSRAQQRRTDLLGLAQLHPARFAVGSFGLASVIGAFILALPIASASTKSIPLIDAFFTATSAVCVTGLVTISPGNDLSLVGQIIVLSLIQIGGLGIMTLSAMIVLATGKQLTGGTEHALGESLGAGTSPTRVLQTVKAIAVGTILIESVGALSIFATTGDQFETTGQAVWFAIFHAVSAFCNAGFALQDDSLRSFGNRPVLLHIISVLIILGGVGFGIMLGIVQTCVDLVRSRLPQLDKISLFPKRKKRPLVDINVKLVAAVTTGLLFAGFFTFLGLEWNNSLADATTIDKFHNAWFQSVTFRTAGFNSVDLTQMQPAMIVLALLLMFIGASPASTGGGIKTSTVAVLCLSLSTVFSKKPDTEVFGRRIEPEVVSRAVAVTIFSLATVFVGSFMLILTQNAPFEVLLFEATSAVATAGLSIGGTAALDDSGKFIVMVLMLVGRVGPITTAALWQTNQGGRRRYPKAEVIVG